MGFILTAGLEAPGLFPIILHSYAEQGTKV